MGDPVMGRCCGCGYTGLEETPCPERKDGVHCVHWWDGPEDVKPKDWREYVREIEKRCKPVGMAGGRKVYSLEDIEAAGIIPPDAE